MDTASVLSEAQTLLAAFTMVAAHPSIDRLDVVLRPGNLLQAVRALRSANWGYLSAITGLDHTGLDQPPVKPHPAEGKRWDRLTDPYIQNPGGLSIAHLEALYHFCHGAAILTLRVRAPHSNPVLPSLCPVIPYAGLYERELVEMLGFRIDGATQAERFILPEDWPDGVYPLRKDFDSQAIGPAIGPANALPDQGGTQGLI
jgi:NADH:ubiquinone oxidoreductase subunit C